MKLMRAEALFQEARELLEGTRQDGTPVERDIPKAERLLNEILDNNVGNPLVLYVLGSLHLTKGHNGLAVQLFKNVLELQKDFGECWNNMGLAFKELGDRDRSVHCARKAAELVNHPDIWANLAGCYVNRGMPEKILEPAEKALELDPTHIRAHWHKAMALLEMGDWEQAWDWHESRLDGGANHDISFRNYHEPDGITPQWDGRQKGRVVIHGEQGLGDEIMFASCIPDAIAAGAEIIVEPNPRLHGLFQRSFPEAKVYGTHRPDGKEWIEKWGQPDYKVAMGSLPKFWRRAVKDFPGTPYLVPDPEKVAYWGKRLDEIGPGLKIGLAWQGGVQSTFVNLRSFHPREYAPLLMQDVDFISLQYDKTAQENVEDVKRELGVTIHHWPEAVEVYHPVTGEENDIDELAALIDNLDLVITVPQTCYHIAGALGTECWVLTPSEPDWRLGVKDETVPWYKSVSLIRQVGYSWAPVIQTAADRVATLCEMKRTAA